MIKAKCKICGYVYDPEKGEKRRNIAPGTEWNDVPDDFRCPSCGAAKKSFIEID
ncbi:MAG: rubredoxin [Methanobrevibacter sp.]|jgi:rubredoxin|nr:rubredoxin [Candidatus Methanovirga australis]